MQSENTAGADQKTTESTGIQHLGELLAESETGGNSSESSQRAGDDAGASGRPDGSQNGKPKKFNDLAGTLGIELDDLYKLEISQADDGTPVTVENLKDYYAKQADFSLREIDFEERRTQQEAQLMQAQDELRELMAALPEKAIKPEVLQKVRDKHEAAVKIERRKTLEVIPEWQDDKTRTADIEGMAEHLKQYGYPVDHLARIADHRQMKYIRDNWLREQRIRKALEQVRAGKPNPTTKQKPAAKSASKNPLTGVKRGNARNKLEAVFSELD